MLLSTSQYILYVTLSYEPSRKLKLHNQLFRARRLRAIIEDAATRADALPEDAPSSYAEAIGILQTTAPYINELVVLTEALRGNYTLEDEQYEELNDWIKVNSEMRDAQFKREQRIIRRELREFGRETNRHFNVDDQLEQRHDAHICKPEEENGHLTNEMDTDLEETEWEKKHQWSNRRMEEGHVYLCSQTRTPAVKKFKSQRSDDKSVTCTEKDSVDLSLPSQTRAARRTLPDNREIPKDRKVKIAAALKDPPELAVASTYSAKTACTKAAIGSSKPRKRCHDCKSHTTNYYKCTYWQLTGSQCGKIFCDECLSTKYTLVNNDAEWHCPSCLKTCLCDTCVRQRQREEEREKSRDQADRRSSRRSAEQTDYTNFFQANGGVVSFF